MKVTHLTNLQCLDEKPCSCLTSSLSSPLPRLTSVLARFSTMGSSPRTGGSLFSTQHSKMDTYTMVPHWLITIAPVVLWTCCSTGHLFLYSLFCVSSQVLWCVVLYCAMLCLLRRTACRWLAQLGSVLAGQSEPQPREPAPPRPEYQHKSTSHGDCDWRKEGNILFDLSQATFN